MRKSKKVVKVKKTRDLTEGELLARATIVTIFVFWAIIATIVYYS